MITRSEKDVDKHVKMTTLFEKKYYQTVAKSEKTELFFE